MSHWRRLILGHQSGVRILCSSHGFISAFSFYGGGFRFPINWCSLRKPKSIGVCPKDTQASGRWWQMSCDWSRFPLRIWWCSRDWKFVSTQLANQHIDSNWSLLIGVCPMLNGQPRLPRQFCTAVGGRSVFSRRSWCAPWALGEARKSRAAGRAVTIVFSVTGQGRAFLCAFSKLVHVPTPIFAVCRPRISLPSLQCNWDQTWQGSTRFYATSKARPGAA